MAARPIDPHTLQRIDAVRDALLACAPSAEVAEKTLFGGYAFMVNGKLCLGVGDDELLCRIHLEQHDATLERPGTREMRHGQRVMRGYVFVEWASLQTKAQFQTWIEQALAYNPLAKAAPRRRARQQAGQRTKGLRA